MLRVATRRVRRLRCRSVPTRALSYPRTTLRQPVGDPGIAVGSRSRPILVHNAPTEISILDNGLRVATQAAFGQYCTIGVLVDAGSKYEVDYPSGVTQYLTKTVLQSTERFDNREAMLTELEKFGGYVDVVYFRDLVMFCLSAYSFSVPEAMETLSEIVWRPSFREEEVQTARQAIASELESYEMHPVPEMLMTELIHRAAYRDNTLGLPSICTEDSIDKISSKNLRQYAAAHFLPSRMVLVGVNVQHDQLVQLAKQHFVSPCTSWEGVEAGPVLDASICQYTGGEVKVARTGAPIIGPNPLPDLTHVAIAMESSPYSNKADFFPFAVLNSLMGGGGSFSAGGPGKGMYTQLYLKVLNCYPWIYHAQALNHAYNDSGIFSIFGSCHPSKAKELTEVFCEQFREMTVAPNKADLSRAKQQLQSSLMMNLESRLINFEDIGRQVLAENRRLPAKELCQMIESVTADDIVRVTTAMRERSLLSLAALGDLSCVPTARQAEKVIMAEQSMWSRLYS